jgi:hypothetical protein
MRLWKKDPAVIPGPEAPASVRADVIDYRDMAAKGHAFTEISDHPDLRHALEDFSSAGWEEPADILMKSCYLLANEESGTILAIGAYVRSAKSEMPLLVWTFTHSGATETRCYEREYAEYIRSGK